MMRLIAAPLRWFKDRLRSIAAERRHMDVPPPDDVLLTTRDVMARYGLRDARAARARMDDAGAFRIGSRLLVRRADLVVAEQRARQERELSRPAAQRRGSRSSSPARAVRGVSPGPDLTGLKPGFYKTDSDNRATQGTTPHRR